MWLQRSVKLEHLRGQIKQLGVHERDFTRTWAGQVRACASHPPGLPYPSSRTAWSHPLSPSLPPSLPRAPRRVLSCQAKGKAGLLITPESFHAALVALGFIDADSPMTSEHDQARMAHDPSRRVRGGWAAYAAMCTCVPSLRLVAVPCVMLPSALFL